MQRKNVLLRIVSPVLLLTFLHLQFFPLPLAAEEPECDYDRNNPTLENARKNFLALNYGCAEQELNDLLKDSNLDTEEKADVHVLLAEVYYAKVRNSQEKKQKVMEQFVAAFDAYRQWKGELNIKSPEFMAMMKEAQTLVDQKTAEEAVAEKPPEETVTEKPGEPEPAADEPEITAAVPTTKVEPKESKPFYKQWWAYALGVGVIAGVVLLAAGGGGDDDGGPEPLDTLEYFPDPPAKGR
jgi:hypothetical protein